jgi:predicted ester cyclase
MDPSQLTPGAKQVWELFDVGWNERDYTVSDRTCADDCRFHFGDTEFLMRSPQAQSIPARWIAAFPDFKFELLDAVEQGDTVALRLRFSGTQRGPFLGTPPTERPMRATQMVFARIEGGKIKELWEDFDALGMWQQLGRTLEP